MPEPEITFSPHQTTDFSGTCHKTKQPWRISLRLTIQQIFMNGLFNCFHYTKCQTKTSIQIKLNSLLPAQHQNMVTVCRRRSRWAPTWSRSWTLALTEPYLPSLTMSGMSSPQNRSVQTSSLTTMIFSLPTSHRYISSLLFTLWNCYLFCDFLEFR